MSDPSPTPPAYEFSPFRLDVESYQLTRDGVNIDTTSKVFDTLLLLIRHRHRVVTKEELLSTVWRDAVVTDDSLIQCISALRRALGDDATRPRYVSTISRRGYRFIAPVTELGGAAEAIEPAPAPATMTSAPAPARTPERRGAFWPILALTLLAAGSLAGWLLGARSASSGDPIPGILRFTQAAPPGSTLASGGVLSPDGRHLAFAAEDATGRTRLWIRQLDAPQPRMLDGTDGASRPFWSPDNQSVGFFADGRLKTVRVSGGPVTTLANVGPRASGAAWSPGGRIIFSTWYSGFSAIDASGGAVSKVTELAPGEAVHAWPQFLPDGDHFLYSIFTGPGAIVVGRLSTGEQVRILEADPGAVYSPAGYLLFTRRGVLTAQGFDASTLSLRGEPFNLATGNVVMPTMTNGTILSASAGGLMAFGGATGQSELAWFDRTGRRLSALSTPIELHNPMLSTDGHQLFANSYPPSQSGIWMVDLERGASNRIVADAAIGVPAPDGQQLLFTATRQSGVAVLSVPLGEPAAGTERTLVSSPERKSMGSMTRDGRFLLYQVITPERGQDIWLLPTAPDAIPTPLLQSAANEIQGQVSPDGNWLAYASDESGTWEVYVQSFPGGTMKQTVSPAGGAEPQWRADGRELFYLATNDTLMSVDVTPGARLQVSRPRALFRPLVIGEAVTYRSHYVASADGQRFLIDVLKDPAMDPISILLNWTRAQ
jgi:DNA-binding winged helix-turn-helix (wHTH) protein/Tol biopolymer transport system component